MRAVFGILGLLIVVAVVGFLAKRQLGPLVGTPAATPQQQSQQLQDQVKKSVEDAMQRARPEPEDK